MTTETMSHTSGVEDQPDPAAWINSSNHVKYTSGPAMADALLALADRLRTLGDTELPAVWMSIGLQITTRDEFDADQAARCVGAVHVIAEALGTGTELAILRESGRACFSKTREGNVTVYAQFARPERDDVVDAEVVDATAAIEATPYVEHRKGMTGRNADGTVNGFCRCSKYFARFADHEALDAAIASHAELASVSA